MQKTPQHDEDTQDEHHVHRKLAFTSLRAGASTKLQRTAHTVNTSEARSQGMGPKGKGVAGEDTGRKGGKYHMTTLPKVKIN